MVSETTSPKYICYCDEVTEDDIVAAMRAGADTVDKVIVSYWGDDPLRLQKQKSQRHLMPP